MNFEKWVQRRWYGKANALWLLLTLPFELIYRTLTALRRGLYRSKLFSSWRAPVPVIVVGNIAVGGTGKTPVTIALCELLQRAGYNPGVISRGYRAQPPHFPHLVSRDDSAAVAGDEPLLIAQRTRCPVVIAPRRSAAAKYLLEHAQCDVIVCDDGLQHYALRRDIEIAVVDAARRFGNGHCLPSGPLREAVARLRSVDAIVLNGATQSDESAREYALTLQPQAMQQLTLDQSIPPRTWCKQNARVHAVAGIGNPARFFDTLRSLGCEPIEHAFPDHHAFHADDFAFADALPIVITEKDAVKCAAFASERFWCLQVRAQLPESLGAAILDKLKSR